MVTCCQFSLYLSMNFFVFSVALGLPTEEEATVLMDGDVGVTLHLLTVVITVVVQEAILLCPPDVAMLATE